MWQTRDDIKNGNGEQWKNLEALYITGHSLGGAMAFLAPLSLYYAKECKDSCQAGSIPGTTTNIYTHLWNKLRGVYTYGQPMVLDPSYDKKDVAGISEIEPYIFRHVFQKDIVPHMPPMSTGRFIHIGQEFSGKKINDKKLEYSKWEKSDKNSDQALSIVISAPIGAMAFVVGLLPYVSWVAQALPWSFADHSPWGYLYVGDESVGTDLAQ